jgi:hypothetical protein
MLGSLPANLMRGHVAGKCPAGLGMRQAQPPSTYSIFTVTGKTAIDPS